MTSRNGAIVFTLCLTSLLNNNLESLVSEPVFNNLGSNKYIDELNLCKLLANGIPPLPL